MFKLILTISGLILLGVGLTASLKTPQETWQDKVSIEGQARRAKAQGKTSITIPGPLVDYSGMGMNVDDVLKKYSAVVAEVVESNTYLDTDVITTAYKFRIVEAVVQKNAVFCDTCPPLRDASARLHPALSNEFILQFSGGTMMVDGVEVNMVNTGGLKFEGGKKYLLFISYTAGGMARLAAGPSGVFRVRDDDESIEPIGNPTHPIPSQIATRFSNKLSKFKQVDKH